MADLKPVACPKCGSEDVTWQEQVWVKRSVLGVDADGVVYVGEDEKMIDDASVEGTETLFCSSCARDFDLGGGYCYDGITLPDPDPRITTELTEDEKAQLRTALDDVR